MLPARLRPFSACLLALLAVPLAGVQEAPAVAAAPPPAPDPATMAPASVPAPTAGEGCPPLFAVQVDYLLWQFKQGRVSQPLAATTDADILNGAPFVARTIFGDQALGDNTARSGIRVRAAALLTSGWEVEASGFLLERGVSTFVFDPASTLSGQALVRPFIDDRSGIQGQNVLNLARATAGSITIPYTAKLYGGEGAIAARLGMGPVESAFAGYRYLALREGLSVNDRSTILTNGLGFFGGLPVNAGDTRVKQDSFTTRNDFHGANLGVKSALHYGWFDLTLRSSIALGVTQETLTVAGSTTLIPAATGTPSSTLPGGLLALPSNIRTQTRTPFAVVPELDLSLGIQLLPHARLTLGYNFLYCSSVVRPGDQVDRTVTLTQVPISPTYNPALPASSPRPAFQERDFWAHGVNVGMLFTF